VQFDGADSDDNEDGEGAGRRAGAMRTLQTIDVMTRSRQGSCMYNLIDSLPVP